MKLIHLLIRELDNCSLGGVFRVSRDAEICQFDRFSLEKEAVTKGNVTLDDFQRAC